jgi:hypothetical protein
MKEIRRISMRVSNIPNTLPLTSSRPPMPPVKSPKKKKIERIYEDDDFVIDLFTEEKMVRVSVFDCGHFKDEVFVRKDEYID